MLERFVNSIAFRRVVSIVIMAILAMALYADVPYPGQEQIASGAYKQALEQLKKQEDKTPNNHAVAFAYYRIYSARSFKQRDLKKAYRHLCHSQDYLKAYKKKDQEKAERNGYTEEMYAAELSKLCYTTFLQTKSANTIEAWDEWLNTYRRAPQKQIDQATTTRDALAYKKAQQANTIEAYESFVRQYPHASQVPQVKERIKNLTDLARDRAEEAEVKRLVRKDDWQSMKQYLSTHEQNTPWRDSVMNYLLGYIRQTHSVDAAKWGLLNLPKHQSETCWRILRRACLEEKDLQRFITFHNIYQSQAVERMQKRDERMIRANDAFNQGKITLEQWIDSVAPSYPAYHKLQGLIQEDLKQQNWAAALAKVQSHKDAFRDNYRFSNLMKALEDASKSPVKAVSVGSTINTAQGNEFAPAISADGNLLYFCGTKRSDNKGKEDIFFSRRNAGAWGRAVPLTDINTADSNEAPLALSVDGTTMLVFSDGKLAITHKEKSGWTALEPLGTNINSSAWQADAMISSDGKAMFFAAMSKVPDEYEMSINIFVSELQEDGSWGKPIDLGATINTPLTDRSPFLHPDMHTLYFCSEGHGSLGGLDVFVSTRLSEKNWTEWSSPVNVGTIINTTGNECWYKISTDGNLAYFSKRENKQNDLYQLVLPEHLRPQPVATIAGKITNAEGEPVRAYIRWEDLDSRELIGFSRTDPTDGHFFIVLPEGKNYGYFVDNERYFPIADNIDLRQANSHITLQNDIRVVTPQQMIDQDISVRMNNIFFDTGEYTLLPTSIAELTRVAKFIKRQSSKVEISGHTDSVGDDESNRILSENRAAAVRDYLISLGVDAKLLIARGYGESKPVATNRTPEGRQLNRRVELRFVK